MLKVMPNIFDKALFKAPGYSIFEQSENRKQTIPIGRNIPVYFTDIYAGDEIDINLVQITKFMPILAPIFHRFSVDFIPAFIPFRLLHDNGFWDSEEFFNPATPDANRPAVPMVSINQLYDGIDKIVGSVWDYLRYPKMLWLLLGLQEGRYSIDGTFYVGTSGSPSYEALFAILPNPWSNNKNKVTIGTNNTFAYIYTLYWYYRSIYSNDADFADFLATGGTEEDFWADLYKVSGLKKDQAIEKYINYLHLELVKAWMANNAQSSNDRLSLIPWLCYRQLMNDWFKNTNIQNVDYEILQIQSFIHDYVGTTDTFDDAIQNDGLGMNLDNSSGTYSADCDKALWQSDYFTSAFQNPQAGSSSVPIPVSGTIPELSFARKLQWALTKTIYGGKRLIDQIWVHRGVKSADMRNHRCEILGHKVYNLRVDDVLQTSSSTIDSSLADFAGYAQSAGGDHLCHYRAGEAGLIMVIARVRPRLEYMDVTPRFILKKDFYDFENPDFDNVGMQPIWRNEISFDSSQPTITFGWQRKYAEYMTGLDSVCGDLCTSMDYWHAARKFETTPHLNEAFITIDVEKDGINRIFAVPSNPRPIVQYLHFDIKTSRPLSRYVSFDY